MRCVYCDTPQARAAGRSVTVEQLAREFRQSGVRLVNVTGGEPLLQPGLSVLLRALRADGVVLVETNGSCDISVIPPRVAAILDLKCPSSGVAEAMDWRNLERLRRYDEVKFVVADRADFDWAARILKRRRLAERCRAVLFSPVAGVLSPAVLAGWLCAARLPARLNLQLHKLAGFR